MNKNVKYFFFLFSTMCVAGCTSSPTSSAKKTKSNGEFIYEKNCTACHGIDGKLCVLGAKDLSLSSISKEESIPLITNGKNTMTAFGSVLTKAEIDSVAGYVQTLKIK
jgi:mono/diheme cytochrome c family protein